MVTETRATFRTPRLWPFVFGALLALAIKISIALVEKRERSPKKSEVIAVAEKPPPVVVQRAKETEPEAIEASSTEPVRKITPREPRDVRQRGLLGLAHVLQQRAGGRDRQWQVVRAEAAQVERAELIGQQARGAGELEMPGRTHARRAIDQRAQLARLVLGNE